MTDGKRFPHRRCSGVAAALLALLCVVHSPRVFAQAPPPDAQVTEKFGPPRPTKPEGPKVRIAGTVVNSATGEPIRRALVMLPESGATMTDARGRFELEAVGGGKVLAIFQKPGFFSENGEGVGSAALSSAKDAPPAVLKLSPASDISGQVKSHDGEPVEGLTVSAYRQRTVQYAWPSRVLVSLARAVTDDAGRFSLVNLPAGHYYLAVEQSHEPKLTEVGVPNGRESVYARSFYPGVAELTAAMPVDVRAGEELTGLALTATVEPVYRVAGTAAGLSSGALMLTRHVGEDSDFQQTVPFDGSNFHCKLPAGIYTARAYNAGTILDSPPFELHADTNDEHILLLPAANIPVQIRREKTGLAAATHADAGVEGEQAGIQMMVLSGGTPLQPLMGNFRQDKSAFQKVETGSYRLTIDTTGPWRVKSAHYEDVDLLEQKLIIQAGAQPAPIEVTLTDDAATLKVSLPELGEEESIEAITGSVSVAGSLVVLLVADGDKAPPRTLHANSNTAELSGLAPGDYSLLAFDPSDMPLVENFEPYLSSATHVHLDPGATTSVTLHSIHGEK